MPTLLSSALTNPGAVARPAEALMCKRPHPQMQRPSPHVRGMPTADCAGSRRPVVLTSVCSEN